MNWFRAGILASLFCVVPLGAVAQDEGAEEEGETTPEESHPENLEATREARQHFMQGIEAFRAHRYREAIQSFELAAQLVPSADLWFNIARAREELSEYESAIEYYQRYLRDRVDPPDRRQIEQHIEELRERAEAARTSQRTEPTQGVLRLSANRPGTRVELDGEDAGEAPWAEPRSLEPGRHQLSLQRDGYIPFRSEVSVEQGVTTAAYADLVPETRYRAIRGEPIFAWIAWGLGVASLGTSIGLGVEALSRQSTDLDGAYDMAAFSDGLLAGAVFMGVVGVVLWFVEGRTVSTERVDVTDDQADDVRGIED